MTSILIHISSSLSLKVAMSENSLSSATTNGDVRRNEVENGHPTHLLPALDTYTVEEMVRQMKELITENNELKGEENYCACASFSQP